MWEQATRIVEKITGWSRPSRDQLAGLIRQRKAHAFRFRDDGIIPNHPRWPLIVYRSVVRFPASLDPAAVLEDLFENNGWGNSWRDGIYDYVHYHSRSTRCWGQPVAPARSSLVGSAGAHCASRPGVWRSARRTGHQRLWAGRDFLVIGAYPPSGHHDVCTSSKDHERALRTIPKVARPGKDPILEIAVQ